MAVNYNILQAQPVPSVVAQLPRDPVQPNPLASLAAGIGQGTQIAAQRQAMDINAAQEGRAKELFPIQKEAAQLGLESGKMDMASKKAAIVAQKQQLDAFAQSFGAGMANLAKTDPKTYLDFTSKKADIQKSMSEVAAHLTDSQSKAFDAQNQMSAATASLYSSASEGRTPEEKQAIYAQKLALSPLLKQVLPAEYSEAGNNAAIAIGTEAHSAMLDKQLAGSMTDLEKSQGATNRAANVLQAAIASGNKAKIDRAITVHQQALSNEMGSIKSAPADQKGPMIQQVTEYIGGMKQKLDSLPEGSPEKAKLKEQYDFALGQAKKDTGLWDNITSSFGKAAGSAVGSIVSGAKSIGSSTAAPAAPVTRSIGNNTYIQQNGKWYQK